MLGWLHSIYTGIMCLVTEFVTFVASGVVAVINLVIVGLAGVAAAVIAVMPSMPTFPSSPSGFWAWANWALPVSGLVALIVGLATLMLAWIPVRVILNWVKAL